MGVCRHDKKIYCAGPLFNRSEREEMAAIAQTLEHAGYKVFLPHRDGLELATILPNLLREGLHPEQASLILNKAIFSLDIFHVVDSDGLVLNMNGRVPDEGAMVEAGVAWAHDRTIVVFNSDSRSLIQGNCNPMIMGLDDFRTVQSYHEILNAFDARFSEESSTHHFASSRFETTKKIGQEIDTFLCTGRANSEIAAMLLEVLGGTTCPHQKVRTNAP